VWWAALCLVVVVGVAGPLAALDPAADPRERTPALAGTEQSPGVGGIVAETVARTLPSTIRGVLVGDGAVALQGEDVDDTGEGDSEADRLIEMKAVGLSADYIREMKEAGFGGSTDDLVGARAVGVTPEFAREMRRFSPEVDIDGVTEAKAVGLSPQYIGEIRGVFPHVDLDGLVEFGALGVTSDYIRSMQRLFPGVTADQIVEMKAVGVSPAFVEEMRRQGLSARDPDEAVEGRLFTQGANDRNDDDDGDGGPVAVAVDRRGGRISIVGARGPASIAIARGPASGD
jgi:hypothetical protein